MEQHFLLLNDLEDNTKKNNKKRNNHITEIAAINI
jgi:hypothetical protein